MVKTVPVKWNEQAVATEVVSVAHWHFALVLPREELWNMTPKLFDLHLSARTDDWWIKKCVTVAHRGVDWLSCKITTKVALSFSRDTFGVPFWKRRTFRWYVCKQIHGEGQYGGVQARRTFPSSRSSLAVHYLCDFWIICFTDLYSLGKPVLGRLAWGVLLQREVGQHLSECREWNDSSASHWIWRPDSGMESFDLNKQT